jgi:exopolysaccharide biosynthesis polyprenyl glycosylphosphotransferase
VIEGSEIAEPAAFDVTDGAAVLPAVALERVVPGRRERTSAFPRRGHLTVRLLPLADGLAVTLAFAAAVLLSGALAPSRLVFLATLPLWIGLARAYGLYEEDEQRAAHSTLDELGGLLHVVAVGTLLLVVASVVGLTPFGTPELVAFAPLALLALAGGRTAGRAELRRRPGYLQNTVIVGAGEVGQLVARKLLRHPETGINIVGFVDSWPVEIDGELRHLSYLGGLGELADLVELLDVERVIVAFAADSDREALELVRKLQDFDVQVDVVPRFFEAVGLGAGLHSVEGLTLMSVARSGLSPAARALKRALDLTLACAALVLLAPLLAAVAAAIKLESKGPVFFHQLRMGNGDEPFRIFKFRTMRCDADECKREYSHLNKFAVEGGDVRMFKIRHDPRVTRFGGWLRRYSLDEVPQLINVLRGEMSLVGPRPLILSEDRHVDSWARHRLDLKPGITGLWQVLGRNEIGFDEMIRLDYLYVKNWSLWTDLKLILRTVPVLLRGGGY